MDSASAGFGLSDMKRAVKSLGRGEKTPFPDTLLAVGARRPAGFVLGSLFVAYGGMVTRDGTIEKWFKNYDFWGTHLKTDSFVRPGALLTFRFRTLFNGALRSRG